MTWLVPFIAGFLCGVIAAPFLLAAYLYSIEPDGHSDD